MPHLRKRHIKNLLTQRLSHSPIVGVLGHRQVGKTTLLEALADRYQSLDDIDQLVSAQKDPKGYLAQFNFHDLKTHGLVAIDECQFAPQLFPALKERVRINKRPGQFILSGSVRFTSKKLIRESLTGRISNLELLPMSVTELEGLPIGRSLKVLANTFHLGRWVDRMEISTELNKRRQLIQEKYLEAGGLPGLCFIRDSRTRRDKLKDQMETLLDRDLPQVSATTLTFQQLFDYWRALSQTEGEPLNLSLLQKQSGVSPATQRKLVAALEAIFLIRMIPLEGERKGYSYWFEDQAERIFLNPTADLQYQWEGLIYRNLREQVFYEAGIVAQFFQYRTRAGVVVPIGIHLEQSTLGFIWVGSQDPSRRELAAASSFNEHYANAKVIFVSSKPKFRSYSSRSVMVPASWLLWE